MRLLSRTTRVYLYEWRVFRAGGDALYQWVAHVAATLCARLPEVQAVYAVGSIASGDIAPGLSDIDMVVVIEDLPGDREFRLILQIERRLRYVLPPFGQDKSGKHVMIYSRTEWQLVGDLLMGKKFGKPKIVFEKQILPDLNSAGAHSRTLHHLFKAFWRLQGLQNQIRIQPGDKLDVLLKVRMCDRLLGALEQAKWETDSAPANRSGFSRVTEELRAALRLIRKDSNEASLVELLPKILDATDQAIECCMPDLRQTGTLPPWSAEPKAQECSNFSQSMALAEELANRLGEAFSRHSIYVARLGRLDLILCEPAPPDLVRAITLHYAAPQIQRVNFVSFRRLRTFYLNEDFGPVAFVHLENGKAFVARGEFSPERFLLEVYAAFPRSRALSRLADPKTAQAYALSLDRLLRYAWNDQQQIPVISDQFGPGASRTDPDLAAAFAGLKKRALELSKALASPAMKDRC